MRQNRRFPFKRRNPGFIVRSRATGQISRMHFLRPKSPFTFHAPIKHNQFTKPSDLRFCPKQHRSKLYIAKRNLFIICHLHNARNSVLKIYALTSPYPCRHAYIFIIAYISKYVDFYHIKHSPTLCISNAYANMHTALHIHRPACSHAP